MKQKHLLSLLFMLAALLSGCSSSDDLLSEDPSADRSQTYEATVVASKGKIDGLENVDEGTRAVFYGGNTARYVTLWDKNDVVYVYKKNGTCVGQLRVTDSENKDAQFQLSAVLSGDLTGEFEENEELDLYLPSKDRTYNPETHQKGTINDLSSRFSFQKTSVQIDKIEGTKITLKEANMSHLQFYVLFQLMDENGNRLHPKKLTISADPVTGFSGRLVSSVDAAGTETYGEIVVTPEKVNGEYPGELFVSLLTGNDNQEKVNYHLTVETEDGEIYEGPSATTIASDDKPFQGTPGKGKLISVARKLTKRASSTTTTATLGDMDGQQGFDNSNKGATLGDMEGQEDL